MRFATRSVRVAQRTLAASGRRAYHPNVLPSLLSTTSPEFTAKSESMDALVKDLEDKFAAVRQGGGPKAAERMRSKGKKLPRERLALLLDPHTPFLELSQLAAHDVYGGRTHAESHRLSASHIASLWPLFYIPATAQPELPCTHLIPHEPRRLFKQPQLLFMIIGRLVHYAFDAALVSTLLAGVRRSSGFTVETEKFSDPTVRSVTEKYLGVGETIFDMVQGTVVNSQYFKRDSRR